MTFFSSPTFYILGMPNKKFSVNKIISCWKPWAEEPYLSNVTKLDIIDRLEVVQMIFSQFKFSSVALNVSRKIKHNLNYLGSKKGIENIHPQPKSPYYTIYIVRRPVRERELYANIFPARER